MPAHPAQPIGDFLWRLGVLRSDPGELSFRVDTCPLTLRTRVCRADRRERYAVQGSMSENRERGVRSTPMLPT